MRRTWFGRTTPAGRLGRPSRLSIRPRAVTRLVVLASLAPLSAFLWGPASASAEPLCTDTWTGPAEARWEVVTDWSAGRVPESSDVVCIGSGKTVEVTSFPNHAGVVEGKGTLKVVGSLEVSNALEASSIAGLTIAGGTLKGAATVDVSGALSWSEGELTGLGTTVVLPGATATLEAAGATLHLSSGHVLVNEGTMTLSAGHLGVNEAQIHNTGVFKVNSEPGGGYVIGYSGTATILNTGTFEKTEGTGTAKIEPTFENQGTVYAQTGSLSFSEGGSSSGANEWHAAEGKSINLAAGTFTLVKPLLSGAINVEHATVTLENGTGSSGKLTLSPAEEIAELIIPSGSTTTIGSFSMNGGTLSGAGTLKASSTLAWTAEGYMTGSGTTVALPGSTSTLSGGGTKYLKGSHVLDNEGTMTFSAGSVDLQETSKLKNAGTFKANSEHGPTIGRGGEEALFLNTGTFEKTEGTGTARIEPKFENLGVLKPGPGKFNIEKPVALKTAGNEYGSETPSNQQSSKCGDPVTCATGNFTETQTDFAIGGRGIGLDLTRTYNSQAAAAGEHGAFGYGWTSSFSDHLVVNKTSKVTTLYKADGATVEFDEESGGVFKAPASTQETLSGTEAAGYTLTLADQTKYKFAGATGRLESVTDRDGNATTLSYSGAGRLETITDPVARKIKLTYNAEGQVESAEDPMGHVVKYTYEGGNLKSVTQPGEAGLRWQFKYDGSHEVTEMTDGNSGKTINEYNGSHQVTLQEDPAEHKLKFEYEGFHTQITNETTGSVTSEYFTSNDEPASITRGYGTASASTEYFTYNEAGDVTSVTDGDGYTTTYGYDSAGDRTSMVDPDKDETTWTYDSTHDVETIKSPKGETTTIKREEHGNPEVIERPAPESKTQLTKFKYTAHGELESVSNPLERTWKYEYNAKGDRTAETDPEGNKRTWEYNEDSQEIATVSPRGNVSGGKPESFKTKIEVNPQGRPLKITDPLGHTTKYTYDGDGNVETFIDGNSHKTKYTYNGDDEPIKVEEPNKTVTETEYDGAGQVVSETDGNKHKTKYVRNALEEIIEIVNPLSKKTLKEYDGAGNLIKLTDPAKRTATYTYDPANRLTEVSYSSGSPAAVKYEYDKDGDRTKMTDGTGTTTYTYDQLDRMIESENGHKEVAKYEYDIANDETKITYPNKKAVTRSFDKDDRLEKVTDWSSNATKFSYDPDSDLEKMVFPSESKDEDKYVYNDADQMTEVKMDKSSEVLASLVYTRDNDGQVKKTTAKGLPGAEVTESTYDENNRVTKSGSTEYKYDAANNPTTEGASTNTYNEGDELEKGTGETYSYDELGERTKATPEKGPATTFGYDQASDLTSVERPKEGETAKIEDTYAYNGEGLRVSQDISGTTGYLVWDMSEELPLVLTDGTYSFVYGPGGLPVEQISTSTGTAQYLHHDQAGSTRLITGSTGTVGGKCTFGAYGAATCEGAAATPLGYDAQYTSTDTGLIYLRNRVYDPGTAQFLTRDPLDEGSSTLAHATGEQYVAAALRSASGSGPYVYANDNPLNNYDPTGLFTVGICVHGEVNFIIHIGASGCVQGSSSGEVGGTVAGSLGRAHGIGAGVTGGPQVSNAEHISELSGPFANAGGQLGFGPDFTLEAFGAPGQCGPVVGGGVSGGLGAGEAQWIGGSYTGAWGVSF
jgi:RHS repeat-associated protein